MGEQLANARALDASIGAFVFAAVSRARFCVLTTPPHCALRSRCPLRRAAPKNAAAQGTDSLWLAQNPSKRWMEVFYLAYSPFWILWALCILVPFQLYEVQRAAGPRPQPALLRR